VALTVALLLRASCLLALIGGASFGLVSALPPPTHEKRLAVRVLQVLQERRGAGAVISLDGREILARCRPLPPWRQLVTLSDGTRFALSGTRATRIPEPGQRQLESTSLADAQLLSAQADLAGSRPLYTKEILGRLQHGRRVVVGTTRYRGVPAYRLRLGRDRPRVELLVSRRTFQPLAARYEGRWVKGSSRLLSSTRARPSGC
jgi:hypothetical protein